MLRWSLSSWSLHGSLASGWPLESLPAEAAARGINTLELCHFHIDTAQLSPLREAIEANGIELFSILIDTGDIASPDPEVRHRDLQTVKEWIDVAATLRAKGVRVDAGRQEPDADVITRSAHSLREVAEYGRDRGVYVFTENWHETSRQAGPLLQILDLCDGKVGLCVDTGNAEGPEKEQTLRALAPRGTSCHFKARYADGKIEMGDLELSAAILKEGGFTGPVSLIYDQNGGGWPGVEALKEALSDPLGI